MMYEGVNVGGNGCFEIGLSRNPVVNKHLDGWDGFDSTLYIGA